ncbi:MAG: signal peptide peptidase SppA [Cyanobacteriota bacterium]
MSDMPKKSFFGQIKSQMRNLIRCLVKDKNVALIKLDGIIMDSANYPMAKKLIKAFKEVEEREIKVMVLRINSPGGTVGASQEIYDAIQKLKAKGTKVVVSCGEVCASGGVYVSCAADKIVANPGTITGSIGVIIGTSNFKKLYEKIGIDQEVVKSGPYKDILSTHRYLTDEERELLQGMIDNSYEQFVNIIANGRSLEPAKVKEFADGRIFTGEQALELGMIDKIGSLKDSIYYAAELVGIEGEPKVINLTQKKSRIYSLLDNNLQNIELKSQYSGIPLWIMPKLL